MDNNIAEVFINGQKQKIIILYYFTLTSNGKNYIFYRFDSIKTINIVYLAELREFDGNFRIISLKSESDVILSDSFDVKLMKKYKLDIDDFFLSSISSFTILLNNDLKFSLNYNGKNIRCSNIDLYSLKLNNDFTLANFILAFNYFIKMDLSIGNISERFFCYLNGYDVEVYFDYDFIQYYNINEAPNWVLCLNDLFDSNIDE